MNKRWPNSGKSKYSGKKRPVGGQWLGVEPIVFSQKGGKIMKEFWRLLKESVIIQGLVTLGFTGATVYLIASGKPVPNELWQADGVILGFFFGAKTYSAVQASRK